jgi:hypothetical protein
LSLFSAGNGQPEKTRFSDLSRSKGDENQPVPFDLSNGVGERR